MRKKTNIGIKGFGIRQVACDNYRRFLSLYICVRSEKKVEPVYERKRTLSVESSTRLKFQMNFGHFFTLSHFGSYLSKFN